MPKNVFELIDDLISGLQQLKDSLAPLSALTAAAAPKAAVAPKPAAPKPARAPRAPRKPAPAAKAPAAPAAKAAAPSSARALQGKYMAAVRVLSKDKQEAVRRVREQEGVEAAIAYARSLKG
ncbi:MAG: hypothetical protein IT186_00080 [Acidobacteria bacterium]|nr:hypothetical protein [Acidobacteriota bacterium]MCG3193607.1 hypothetical protein [Thermoanaerobaculia bacterium]MCK6683944.1 hypothetical protein [Thermoanaerobaculia bacterium]